MYILSLYIFQVGVNQQLYGLSMLVLNVRIAWWTKPIQITFGRHNWENLEQTDTQQFWHSFVMHH